MTQSERVTSDQTVVPQSRVSSAVIVGLLAGMSLNLLAGCQSYGPMTSQETVDRLERMDADKRENFTAEDVAFFRVKAQGNDALAQLFLGVAYRRGSGVEQDLGQAIRWFELAAQQGMVEASLSLSAIYSGESSGHTDYAKALAYARRAAAQGSLDGQALVAAAKLHGHGMPANVPGALADLHSLAGQNAGSAMLTLARTYEDGQAVPTDKVVAAVWYELAQSRLVYAAEKAIALQGQEQMALSLLPADRDLVSQLVKTWRPGQDVAAERAKLAKQTQPTPALAATTAANAPVLVEQQALTHGGERVRDRSQLPVIGLLSIEEIEVKPDLTVVSTEHHEHLVNNESAAKEYGELPITYNDELDKVTIIEAYTRKPNGQRIPYDPKSVQVWTHPDGPQDGMYDSRKQMMVIFPQVAAKDVMVLTVRYESRPLIPGVFNLTRAFSETFAQERNRITISAPKDMTLFSETVGLKFTRRAVGQKQVLEWEFSNPHPLVRRDVDLSALDRFPRLFVSNQPDHESFIRQVAQLTANRAELTPAIKRKAAEITAGLSDPQAQARALYQWVAREIRYVGLEIGQGAVQPRPASDVLANGYGDCKDKAVLLQALLKARAINSDLVLAKIGNGFNVPRVPVISTFNHMILHLPDFNLYLDSTAGVAPYGLLPFTLYGKTVAHIGATSGPVLRRIPFLGINDAVMEISTTARLEANGRLVGTSKSVGQGPFAIDLRQTMAAVQSFGTDRAAKNMLVDTGLDGSGQFDFADPHAFSSSYQVTARFEAKPQSSMVNGNGFYMPKGLVLLPTPANFLAGPIALYDETASEPTSCYPGRQISTISLELPKGKKLRDIPKNSDLDNEFGSYHAHWSQQGNVVTVRREFVSKTSEPICIGRSRYAMAELLGTARLDLDREISLVDE